MFERRDTSASPTPGTHAPDFIKPLAYASLAIPILFLVVAGIWIALRFGSSNLNPADVDMNSPEDEEDDDDDEDEEGEKEGEGGEKLAGSSGRGRRTGGDGQMQPLLEDDEDDDDEGEEDSRADQPQTTTSSASAGGRKRNSVEKDGEDQETAAASTPASKWKIQPGFSSTVLSSRGKGK
ncbi:hypothetical protein CF326_g2240 [Tilletia indica]|nr:hypothetical protein CF326_g2240 [Tilletia indica]